MSRSRPPHARQTSTSSPNTARKYLRAGLRPAALTAPRTWRTREDPFAADWAELRARLAETPELEATTLFEDLLRRQLGGHLGRGDAADLLLSLAA